MNDEQGTTAKQDRARLLGTIAELWPNPFDKGYDKKTRLGDFLHAAMNLVTESVRRNAQFVAKALLLAPVIVLVMVYWQ